MKCWHCNDELIHLNTFEYDEISKEGEGKVDLFICSNEKCNAEVEIYKDL